MGPGGSAVRRYLRHWDPLLAPDTVSIARLVRLRVEGNGLQRRELIGEAATWEELDTPICKKEEGEDEEWDVVEACFSYLCHPLAGR
ncbi:hypothetical protein EV426DRAFT_702870 [Tirmania nivea]|nr:hypothetical protein EV426DRAFT_702870 [Tirmania nivea]